MTFDLVRWLREVSLPLWGDAGFDRHLGLFHERLDFAARPIAEAPRRLMVQARQIHVFAAADMLGWFPGGVLAEQAAEQMLRRFMSGGARNGFAFSVGPDGGVHDEERDLYAQAFALFALAWMTRLTGRTSFLDVADATLAFLDARMATPRTGGYRETLLGQTRRRRQNPHMHLVEALLALHEADPERGYARRASQLVELLERRFLHGARPVLVEFYDEKLLPEPAHSYRFEPGHHFEWAWLLAERARLTACPIPDLAVRLYDSAAATVSADGAIADLADEEGGVCIGATRLWPHTEAIRAATLAFPTDRAIGQADLQERVLGCLFRRFLNTASDGCWTDHYDAAGHRLSTWVPASSLYHLVGAARQIASRLQAIA